MPYLMYQNAIFCFILTSFDIKFFIKLLLYPRVKKRYTHTHVFILIIETGHN